MKAVVSVPDKRHTVEDVHEDLGEQVLPEEHAEDAPGAPAGSGGDGVQRGAVSICGSESGGDGGDDGGDGGPSPEHVQGCGPMDAVVVGAGIPDDIEATWEADTLDTGAPSSGAAVRAIGDTLGDPKGRHSCFKTVYGKEVQVPLSHRTALSVQRSRKWHMHMLKFPRGGRESVIPFGDRARQLSAHPDFESDLARLAYDDGNSLLELYVAVRDGILPEIPARYRNLAPAVQAGLRECGMCMVWTCRNQRSSQTSYKGKYLCEEHLRADLRIRSTREVVRLCTKCHKIVLAAGFAAGPKGKQFAQCRACYQPGPPKGKGKKKQAEGGTSVAVATPAGTADAKACGEGDVVVLDAEVRPSAKYVHPEPSAEEMEAGGDASGEYLAARRMCAVAAGEFRVGECLSNPYIVRAHYHPDRVRGSDANGDNPGAQKCVNVTCTNDHAAQSRTVAMLCKLCMQVCVL